MYFAKVVCLLKRNAASPYTRRCHRHWKTCTFFVRPVHDTNWVLSLNPVVGQNLQHLDTSSNSENTNVPSPCRLSVQMASYICRWLVVLHAWSYSKYVTHLVNCSFAAQGLCCLHEPVSCLLVAIREGKTRHPSLCSSPARVNIS